MKIVGFVLFFSGLFIISEVTRSLEAVTVPGSGSSQSSTDGPPSQLAKGLASVFFGEKQLPIMASETYQVPHCREHFSEKLPESNANYDYVSDLGLGWGDKHVLSYIFEDHEFIFERNSLFLDFWKALRSNISLQVDANPQDRYVLIDWRDVPSQQRNNLIRLRVDLPEADLASNESPTTSNLPDWARLFFNNEDHLQSFFGEFGAEAFQSNVEPFFARNTEKLTSTGLQFEISDRPVGYFQLEEFASFLKVEAISTGSEPVSNHACFLVVSAAEIKELYKQAPDLFGALTVSESTSSGLGPLLSDSTSSEMGPSLSSGLSSGGSCQFHAASANILIWILAVLLLLTLNGRVLFRSGRMLLGACSLFFAFGFAGADTSPSSSNPNDGENASSEGKVPPPLNSVVESFHFNADEFHSKAEYSSRILSCEDLLPNYVDTQIDFLEYLGLGPMGSLNWPEDDPSLSLEWAALASESDGEKNPYARYLVFFNSVAELEEISFKVDLHTNWSHLLNEGLLNTGDQPNTFSEDTSGLWKDLFAVDPEHYEILERRGYFSGDSFPFFANSTIELAKGVRVALHKGSLNVLPLDQFAPHVRIKSLVSDELVSQHFCWAVITREAKEEIEEAYGHPLSPVKLIATSESATSSFDGDSSAGGPLSQEDIMISESGTNSFSGATGGRCQMAATQTSLSLQLMIWTLLLSLLLFKRSSLNRVKRPLS